jgi:hypothetical protein
MHIHLLRLFQKNVLYQCEYMIVAYHGIQFGLEQNDGVTIFRELQNFLSASANVSKLLWGQRGKNLEPQRNLLRDSIGVADDSPLRIVRMRNHFEHLDERLDEWWRDSKQHNSVDFCIAPPDKIVGFDTKELFRVYDPDTGIMHFWGDEFNIREIMNEVIRILPTLRQEAEKPHWEVKQPTMEA